MNWPDWIILGIIIASTVTAITQGFFREALSLAGVVAGFLVAAWGYHQVAPWFLQFVKEPWIADIVAFVLIFLGVVLLASLAGRLMQWMMKETGLSWFDRLLGAAFGLVRGVLMVAVLLLGITSFVPNADWLAGSRLAPYFLVLARGAVWAAPEEVRARFEQGLGVSRELRHNLESHGTTLPGAKP